MMYKRLFAVAIAAALLFSVAGCGCSLGTPAGIPDKEVYAFIADGLFEDLLPAGVEGEYKIQSHAVKQTEKSIYDTVTVAVGIDQGIYKASGTLTAKFYKSIKGETWKLSSSDVEYGEDFKAEWDVVGVWEGTAKDNMSRDDSCLFRFEILEIDNSGDLSKFSGKLTTDIEILRSKIYSLLKGERLEKNIAGHITKNGILYFNGDPAEKSEPYFQGEIDIQMKRIEEGIQEHPISSSERYTFEVTYTK